MTKPYIKLYVLVTLISLACLSTINALAGMTLQSLTGAVTAAEISSFESFMSGQSPPATNTYDNTIADGTAGMESEALGMMYEVTNDPALLNEMIQFADQFLALRNDYTDRRVMWDGNVDPVWLTKSASSSEAGYAGCENNDIVGHIAYCAKLILETPALWNSTIPDGNPHGYGATYYERATNYIGQMEYSEANYFNQYFVSATNYQIIAPASSAWTTFGESVNAWNRQMMFLNGWQRLAECHELLDDHSTNVTYYNHIVQASINWFFNAGASGLVAYTTNSNPVYNWDYAPLSGGSEDLSLHADYDLWGMNRAYLSGLYTNLSVSQMVRFANTLQYVVYKGNNTFADWVSGDSVDGSRDYIYPAWTLAANFGPENYFITANANIAQGSQGSTAIFDAFILWVKNARYLGSFASNTNSADYTMSAPWIQTVAAGGNTSCQVIVSPLDGFGSSVTLGASGLPSGVTASFSPSSISGGSGTSTLTLTASSSTTPGVYSLGSAAITGNGGSISRLTPMTLIVTATPTFSVSAAPASQNITIGNNTSYTVTVGSLNGFSGNVALTASGLPANASSGFSPASITGGSGSSTLTITTATNTPSGNDTLTITGTSGTLTNSTTVSLLLNDFSLSTAPSSQSVTQGGSTNYTVTVGNVNGFAGTVTLGASGLPAGASASFNPASITSIGNSTMTVTTAGTTPASTNTLTITGVSGSLQHSTTATLVVDTSSGGGSGTWTTNNDTSSSITYSAGWSYSTNRNDGDYNNDVHYTKTNASYAQFTFSGTGIQYLTETYSDESNVDVYIDGVFQATVSCYSATRQSQVVAYSNTGLSAGSHTIKVVKDNATYMLLDAFAYQSAPAPDFTLATSPSLQTVVAGNGAACTNTISAINGFSGSVSFAVTGLPAGVSGSFNPAAVSGSGSSTLTLTTTNTLPASTNALTITATSGSLAHSNTVTLMINPVNTGALPNGWTDSDIGAVGLTGSAFYTNGVFTIQGSGTDIFGTSDEFNYCRETVTNDFTLTARVASLNSANAWSKSGVMIRGSASTNSAYVGIYVTTGNGVDLQCRTVNSSNAVDLARISGITAPYWVQLVRSGNAFTGYCSPDGSTWTQVGSTNVSMAAGVRAGLSVCSHDNTQLNTSTFDNVTAQ